MLNVQLEFETTRHAGLYTLKGYACVGVKLGFSLREINGRLKLLGECWLFCENVWTLATVKSRVMEKLRNEELRVFSHSIIIRDRLCGLVVRVSGYRYRGLGFDSRRYQIF